MCVRVCMCVCVRVCACVCTPCAVHRLTSLALNFRANTQLTTALRSNQGLMDSTSAPILVPKTI